MVTIFYTEDSSNIFQTTANLACTAICDQDGLSVPGDEISTPTTWSGNAPSDGGTWTQTRERTKTLYSLPSSDSGTITWEPNNQQFSGLNAGQANGVTIKATFNYIFNKSEQKQEQSRTRTRTKDSEGKWGSWGSWSTGGWQDVGSSTAPTASTKQGVESGEKKLTLYTRPYEFSAWGGFKSGDQVQISGRDWNIIIEKFVAADAWRSQSSSSKSAQFAEAGVTISAAAYNSLRNLAQSVTGVSLPLVVGMGDIKHPNASATKISASHFTILQDVLNNFIKA